VKKRKWGDRRDGVWLRDIDSMHIIMPFLYKNRCDNEAFISQTIDVTELSKYIDEKNKGDIVIPYTIFHALIAAFGKTLVLRPEMNRFIKRKRVYQRNNISAAFVIKKQFCEDSHEALAFIPLGEEDNIDSVHKMLEKEITYCRSENKDNTTDAMDMMKKLPFPILSFIMWIYNLLDNFGLVPESLIKTDPNQATVFISNFGSIDLPAGYHHLSNWGTCSIFVVMGKYYDKEVTNEKGEVETRKFMNLGLTVDERISDGYYYSKTAKLLKYLSENRKTLDTKAKEIVDYE
jgi:hypothetical protein